MIGSLTAAASRILTPRGQVRRAGQSWQDRLWEIYEHLGPVHYGVGFKRNAAQKVTYFPAEQVEDQDEPVPTEDQRAIEAFERLGSFEEIVGEFVIHENVAGEGYLVGQERDGVETWDVWSTAEYNHAQSAATRDNPDDVLPLATDDFVLRIWRASPYKHSLPDSPLRSVQQQCEQLLLLNEQIGAVAMSRLSAGILLVPNELSFIPAATEPPATGANADGDPFMAEIIDIATLPITDAESAARVAPAVIRGAAEYLEKITHLTFGREIDKTFAEMREELLRQIAAGLDLPPEIILGKADLNHWSAWDVDDSAAKLHVDPDVLFILDGVTTGYYRPALEELGIPDTDRFLIWRDYSDLTSRPMSIDQAVNLFERSVIDADEVRRIANIADDQDDTVGPGDIAARAESVGVLIRAGFDPQAALTALGLPQIEHTGLTPVTVSGGTETVTTPVDTPAGPDNVDRAPPGLAAAGELFQLSDLADIDRTLVPKIMEASESAFERAMEKAGARIRAKAKKDRNMTAVIDKIPNMEVARHLGMQRVEQLQLTADQLLPADTFDPLRVRLNKLITDGQAQRRSTLSRLLGLPVPELPEEAEDRDNAIDLFLSTLIALATVRLFTDQPDPDPAETGEISDTITTGQMVYQLLTQAGGGGQVEVFTPDTPRGLALGQRTRALLNDHGYLTVSETWVYGFPSRPFEPHRALAGQQFTEHHGPPPPLTALWLGVDFMFPGDHKGCLCQLVPTVEVLT